MEKRWRRKDVLIHVYVALAFRTPAANMSCLLKFICTKKKTVLCNASLSAPVNALLVRAQ